MRESKTESGRLDADGERRRKISKDTAMGSSVSTFVGNVLADDINKDDSMSHLRWIGDVPESFKENPNKMFFMISLDDETSKHVRSLDFSQTLTRTQQSLYIFSNT